MAKLKISGKLSAPEIAEAITRGTKRIAVVAFVDTKTGKFDAGVYGAKGNHAMAGSFLEAVKQAADEFDGAIALDAAKAEVGPLQ
jgi:hypothetical protein